jgi:hypothetical protein
MMLGGPPRAGKGIIARRCLEEWRVPFLSLDVLKMGLHHALPSVGIELGTAPVDVGRKMWPLIRAMAQNAVECQVDYLFEGDMLVPSQVLELQDLLGSQLRACFVGYRDIAPNQKLAEIRAHAGLPNDWLTEHDDDYILEVVEYGIDFSRGLSEECALLDIAYFDGSRSFEEAVVAAVSYLASTPEVGGLGS